MLSILEIRDGAVHAQNEIWGQYAECLVEGLPENCTPADISVTLSDIPLQVTEVGSGGAARLVTLRLPDSIHTGWQPVRVTFGQQSAEKPVRVLGRRGSSLDED